MKKPSPLLRALFLCSTLALGCTRREFPPGFPKAYMDEAIRMTEAVVPYCKDMLATPGCPYQDPDDESIEYRSPSPAGSLPIFEHPFQGSSDVLLQYSVACLTRDDHPRHHHACDVRGLEHAIGSPPDECEQLSAVPGWDALRKGQDGESLRISTNPRCPLPQYRLSVRRSTSGKAEAAFYGVFLKPGTRPPWKK